LGGRGGGSCWQTGSVREELWRAARRHLAVRALGLLDRGFKALRRAFDAIGRLERDCTAHIQVREEAEPTAHVLAGYFKLQVGLR
jgi:hypothetical protein